MKNKSVKVVFPLISSVLIWIFPALFLYMQNVKEVGFIETIEVDMVLCLCAILFFIVGLLIYRDIFGAGVFSIISGVILSNFAMILSVVQNRIPALRYWHMLFLLLLLSLFLASYQFTILFYLYQPLFRNLQIQM